MRIPCEVAEDLMPLVKDGVASESSNLLLHEHLSECQACKKLFDTHGFSNRENATPKLKKLKWVIFTAIALLLTVGGLIGYFTSSANTPMPIALLIVGLLSLIPVALILGKEKPKKMNRFFYGKAIGTIIIFALLGIFLLLKYVFGLF